MMQHKYSTVQCQDDFGRQTSNQTKTVLGYLNSVTPITYHGNYELGGALVSLLNKPETYLWLDHKEHSEIKSQLARNELSRSNFNYIFCKVDMNYMVQSWVIIKSPLLLWQLNELFSYCYRAEDVLKLIEIGNKLESTDFYDFFWRCLSDLDFIRAFVSIPASKSHHHAFPGGLLQHSIECVNIVESNLELIAEISQNEKEATLLASLFHDAGKVKTLSIGEHTPLGKVMDHEAFTLSVLSDSLGQLQKSWYQGATVLQYLLTWKENQGFCKFVGGNVLKMADRLSTSYSLYKQGFHKKPKHHFFASIQVGKNVKYVNRLP
ncbi:hypothetical protein JCM30760_22460 [Thiomicrorhabdus hydrogeniphila]